MLWGRSLTSVGVLEPLLPRASDRTGLVGDKLPFSDQILLDQEPYDTLLVGCQRQTDFPQCAPQCNSSLKTVTSSVEEVKFYTTSAFCGNSMHLQKESKFVHLSLEETTTFHELKGKGYNIS